MGAFDLQFYACTEQYRDWGNCLNMNDEKVFSNSVEKIQPSSMPEVGSKTIYTLEISDKYFKQAISVAKEVMILAVFTVNQKSNSIAALEFSNPNKLKRIREDKAVE